ncbi:MAG: hypothetical protein Kow0098_14650 [Ignavibacteriaceae bacterium]
MSNNYPESAGGVSTEAVKQKTGKSWAEWFKLIDKAGGAKLNHREIVAFITKNYKVTPWWQQMIAVSYEQERGLRDKHQKPEGYQISKSKTFPVPVSEIYDLVASVAERKKWLKDYNFNVTKETKYKSIRAKWIDNRTNIEIQFYQKDPQKTQVVVQHSKLPDSKEANKMKTYWAKQLEKLGEMFI